MSNAYQLIIDAIYKGGAAFKQAQGDLDGLNKKATAGTKQTGMAFGGLKTSVLAAGVAIGGVAVAVGRLYGTLREGAQLQTTALRFDKLSESIGTTADTMLGKLREATQGMIADAELMASASQIMSLRLAENEDQVIRLATVSGRLNWDMQQVILTFANMSTMRLDALGLSVEEVTSKAKELEKTGMSAQEAFKEAVILAGEARLDVAGLSESEQAFKRLEAAIANSKNELSLFLIELAESIGLIENLSRTAAEMQLNRMAKEALASGEITRMQFMELAAVLRENGVVAAQATFEQMLLIDAQNKAAASAQSLAQTNAILGVSILDVTQAQGDFIMQSSGMISAIDNIGDAALENAEYLDEFARAAVQSFVRSRAVAGVMGNIADANTRTSLREMFGNMSKVGSTAREYGAGLGYAASQADLLAEAHSRMTQAFETEAGMDIADGLINAEGLVNIENANKALYEQAKAAGASAGELALLGVATGQLTEEQAQAALKAAILMERIKQIASAVASGDMSIGDAMGGLSGFQQQLDSGALGGIEGLTQAADEFANGNYQATLDVENAQALAGINAVQEAVNNLDGTYYVNIQTTSNTPGEPPHRAMGGPVSRNVPYFVGERGPELFVPGASGSIVPNNQLEKLLTRFQGGAPISVQVTNYISGGGNVNADELSNQTRDKLQAALAQVRVR